LEDSAVTTGDERIRELCELASKEEDPEKLLDFVAELNRILEAKEKRLLAERKTSQAKSAD
jgi:malate synthase